jgi:hypothetical protein
MCQMILRIPVVRFVRGSQLPWTGSAWSHLRAVRDARCGGRVIAYRRRPVSVRTGNLHLYIHVDRSRRRGAVIAVQIASVQSGSSRSAA